MVILSEWNDSAVILILSLFFIPVAILFFATLWTIKLFPKGRAFLDYKKKETPIMYLAILFLLFATCVLLTYGVLMLFN